eukprot:maker-scaffold770_size100439-snap-gene-0.30 protein:Tk05393 transcript:maker-scaffold770_size100439-snap-gene-0.30-mRNA-1 annotation:"hypothetical protein DAPPUDRAFT_129710"
MNEKREKDDSVQFGESERKPLPVKAKSPATPSSDSDMSVRTDRPKTSSVPLSQHLSKLRVHKSGKPKGAAVKSEESPQVSAPVDMPPLKPEDIPLPYTFCVKGLGKRKANGLWGIKQTRGPVDEMVTEARSPKSGMPFLPFLQLHVSEKGVSIEPTPQNVNPNFDKGPFPIDSISYGVQDIVYTRVFAMIVVRDPSGEPNVGRNGPAKLLPFDCYAFVCDSRLNARKLTFALAKAFQAFSKTAKSQAEQGQFAIDLRTPEQIEADLEDEETEA